jgi:hypothetical protein
VPFTQFLLQVRCQNPTASVPTYTVWTDFTSYTEFIDSFGPLDDGYYFRYEFTSSQWNTISSTLTNEGKHNWTEGEIRNWFIGRGFGDSESTQETAWLLTIDHGFIASRSGSIVYMILK